MHIKRFPLGALKSNCYIVHNDKEAYIVDPGYASQDVIAFIKQHNLTVSFIYITHGHPDHIGGINMINAYLNVPVYAPIKDQWWIETYGPSQGITATITTYIKEPFKIPFANDLLAIYDVPGHSKGGTIIYSPSDQYLFSGDTLFYETVGRTDIPHADQAELVRSIKRMYDLFPNETTVYPGHGRSTTIKHEKECNAFVKKDA